MNRVQAPKLAWRRGAGTRAFALFLIAVLGCDDGPTAFQQIVARVIVSPTAATVTIGASTQLSATVQDVANNVLLGRAVTWASSNAAIANVDGTGMVTAMAPGTATITGTSEGRTGSATITVPSQTSAPVATVAVAPLTATVAAGATTTLTATTRDASNNVLTGRAITWTSSNTSVATVNGGVVTGVASGTATITATSESQSGTATITVTAASSVTLTSITLSPPNANVQTGGTVQFSVIGNYSNGTTGPVTVTYTATGGTVSAGGLYTAGQSAGTFSVIARASTGQADTSAVAISAPVPAPPPGTPVCEAVAPGRCWHIALNGSDSNAGTYAAPFASFARAQTAAGAGDFIYYLAGVYTNDATQFIDYSKSLNAAAGERITVKPHPGHTVVFDNQGRDGSIAYLGGQGVVVEGFEFRNSTLGGPAGAMNGWTQGVAVWGRYNHFRKNYVHDITGSSNGNGGGLRIQDSSDNEVYNNYFDRLFVGGTGAKHNVNHVIVMDGRNNRIYNNYFSNSAGGCFLQKHDPRAGNVASVFNNTFVNCLDSGVNIQGFGYTVHHNLFIDSDMNYDYTGAYNNIFEYNTIVSSAQSLITGTSQPNTIRRNILYQTATSFSAGNGGYTLRLSHYLADSEYQQGIAGDVIDYNCYYNPNLAVRFSYYGGSPTTTGGVYTLAQFKAIGKDTNSVEANPMFVNAAANDYRTQAGSACANMGAYAGPNAGNPPLTPAAALGRTP